VKIRDSAVFTLDLGRKTEFRIGGRSPIEAVAFSLHYGQALDWNGVLKIERIEKEVNENTKYF
jgi:hypothetical protein